MPQSPKLTIVKSEPLTVSKSEPLTVTASDKPEQGILSTIGEGVTDFGAGALKSIPETLLHLAKAITWLTGQKQVDSQIDQQIKRFEPTNAMQSLGMTGGDIAQALIPQTKITEGAQAMRGLVRGASEAAPLIRRALGVGAQSAVEGAGAAGIAAAQGTDPTLAAVGGAGMVPLQVGAKKIAPFIVKTGLGETAAMRRANPGAVNAVLDQGVLPRESQIEAAFTKIENELTDLVSKADQAPPVSGLLGPGTEWVPLGPTPTGGSMAVSSPAKKTTDRVFRLRRTQGMDPLSERYKELMSGTQYIGMPKEAQSGFGGPGVVEQPRVRGGAYAGEAPPTMVAPKDLAAFARDWVTNKANLESVGLKEAPTKELNQLVASYLRSNAKPMTVADALAQKRAEQALAIAAYKKRAAGGTVSDIEALFHEGLAAANRAAVLAKVPKAFDLLSREQQLIALEKATQYAANKPSAMRHYLQMLASVGGVASGRAEGAAAGIGAAALMEASRNPTFMSLAGQAAQATGNAAKLPQIIASLVANLDRTPVQDGTTVTIGSAIQDNQRSMLESNLQETLRQYDMATGDDKVALGRKLAEIQRQLAAIK